MSQKPTLLVLAAGMGSRYGGLKQIDPVGPSGEIIIDYSIYDAIRAGFGKVVFIIRHDIEKDFKECIGNRFKGIIDVDYVFQEKEKLPAGFSVPEGRTKPWGTAHAILMAKDVIKEPFAVINADDFYGASGFKVMGEYLKNAQDKDGVADWSMVGYVLRNTLSDNGSVSRGVCQLDPNNSLIEVVERTKIEKEGASAAVVVDDPANPIHLTGDEYVSMNLWGFTPSFFDVLEKGFIEFLKARGNELKSEYYIAIPVTEMLNAKKATVKVLPTQDSWFGITYPEDKPFVVNSVKSLVQGGAYPEKLFN